MTKAISKVIFNNDTLMDVTQDTVESSKLHSGYTATGADGQPISGSYVAPLQQTKTATPTTSQQTISPDSGYLLSSVTVNAIPSEYIIPTGTVSITDNGTVNVTQYASANVAVPTGTDVHDATATQDEICLGKTAYIATGKTTGTGDIVHAVASVPNTKDTNIVHVGNDYYAWRGSGGDGGTGHDVIFIDYNGDELYHYSIAEINAMTSDSDLPTNPDHTDMGLTAQGWNWTVQQLKTQLTAMPDQKVYVGQMYVTTSGATEIDIDLQEERKSPYLRFAVNGSATIDWGDNSATDTVTSTSLTSRKDTLHTYSTGGQYTIKITVPSGSEMSMYGTSTYPLLHRGGSTSANRVYANAVKAVRVGERTRIGNSAFQYCYSLMYVTMPSNVISFGTNAFNYCYNLVSATIPSGVTSTNTSAFAGCYNLTSVSIPSSVTTLTSSTFSSCYILKSVTIPNSVTSIEANAFSSCYNLAQTEIPNNVTSIGASAFGYCFNLVSATIPSGVTSINESTFTSCYSLKSVVIPNTVTSIGKTAFSTCYSLASMTIPSNVTSIGQSMASSCNAITNITILGDITSIESNTFYACYSLVSLTIPSTVTSIATQAFSNCYGMKEYHFKPTVPPALANTDAFQNIQSDCVIYVPYSSDHSILTAYQTATNWSEYASYMQEEPAS